MERIHKFLTRRPLLALASLVIATLPFIWGATRARIENPLDGWFVRGDPVLAEYRSYQERFGNDETVLIAIHSPEGVFRRPVLKCVAALTRSLSLIEHVREVLSLESVPVVKSKWGRPRKYEMGEVLPLNRARPSSIRAYLQRDAVSWPRLVSKDEKTSLLYVMQESLEDDSVRTTILANIRSALERHLRAMTDEVVAIGAPPASGKTSIAIQTAFAAVERGATAPITAPRAGEPAVRRNDSDSQPSGSSGPRVAYT